MEESRMTKEILNMDCLDVLTKLDSNSVDLVVTDPPYGYSFMGKDWDKVVVGVDIWKECLRVLKPGSFAYIMSAPRQDVLSHMIVNLEKAGFKTGFTSMYWAYATGFPKAMNVAKAVDKKLGVEPTTICRNPNSRENCDKTNTIYESGTVGKTDYITTPTSDKAKGLDGSYAGFQPKPAVEVILVVMKPLDEKTYLEQAMKDRRGVSWFDDCRVPPSKSDEYDLKKREVSIAHGIQNDDSFLDQIHDADAKHGVQDQGRFPANLLVSNDSLNTGVDTKSSGGLTTAGAGFNKIKGFGVNTTKGGEATHPITMTPKDSGSFSRYYDLDAWYSQFIITPKASKSEKNRGLDNLPDKIGGGMNGTVKQSMKTGSGNERNNIMKNNHPTVKPIKLMTYLVTLGSRPTDLVLDPFAGSGTTGIACIQTGRDYILIEKDKDYYNIMLERLHGVSKQQTL
jgi:site-specific DNA-methyltransferase (adenine-specific)